MEPSGDPGIPATSLAIVHTVSRVPSLVEGMAVMAPNRPDTGSPDGSNRRQAPNL
ncbi:hypothetical protein KSZ_18440 [Dictyobacter formicarum]|uniref:Uncharacterized protein n=1 Tax=Dictyobacter formicarum TaxID=2778368 RepID=A0ABQ3VEM3_9CHLR|nr:hypothetical protein KSZ_18440 [Dictyobacter formicarum]